MDCKTLILGPAAGTCSNFGTPTERRPKIDSRSEVPKAFFDVHSNVEIAPLPRAAKYSPPKYLMQHPIAEVHRRGCDLKQLHVIKDELCGRCYFLKCRKIGSERRMQDASNEANVGGENQTNPTFSTMSPEEAKMERVRVQWTALWQEVGFSISNDGNLRAILAEINKHLDSADRQQRMQAGSCVENLIYDLGKDFKLSSTRTDPRFSERRRPPSDRPSRSHQYERSARVGGQDRAGPRRPGSMSVAAVAFRRRTPLAVPRALLQPQAQQESCRGSGARSLAIRRAGGASALIRAIRCPPSALMRSSSLPP